MEFRNTRITIDGEHFDLRELSGRAVEAAQAQDGDTRQGYAMIALSLCNSNAVPTYSPETLDSGLDHVMDLPARVAQTLSASVSELNAVSMDDARKN